MRNRSNQTYYLYLGLNQGETNRCFFFSLCIPNLFLNNTQRFTFSGPAAASNDDGKFLLAAKRFRRPTCTDYIISLNCDDVSRGSNTYIGKLRYLATDWPHGFFIYLP